MKGGRGGCEIISLGFWYRMKLLPAGDGWYLEAKEKKKLEKAQNNKKSSCYESRGNGERKMPVVGK